MCSLGVDCLECLLEAAFLNRRLIILVLIFVLFAVRLSLLSFVYHFFVCVVCSREDLFTRELGSRYYYWWSLFILFLLFAYIFSMLLWDIFFVYYSISNVKAYVVELT